MWIFVSTNRVAVWKDMTSDNAHHFASMTTRVWWQACVGFRMDIPRAHPVTDLEFWWGWCRAFARRAAANHIVVKMMAGGGEKEAMLIYSRESDSVCLHRGDVVYRASSR